MLSVLTSDHIGNVFWYFFNLYGHQKVDLKFAHGRAEKKVRGNKICRTSESEIAEENNRTTSFLRKKVRLVADTFA